MFLIESNQADGSTVSCFFRQSDCSLARLAHVCLLQSLWWTSAVSRPGALRPNVVNPFFVFCGLSLFLDERKEGWGDVKRRFGAVEPVMFACVYRSHLYGKETLFRFI